MSLRRPRPPPKLGDLVSPEARYLADLEREMGWALDQEKGLDAKFATGEMTREKNDLLNLLTAPSTAPFTAADCRVEIARPIIALKNSSSSTSDPSSSSSFSSSTSARSSSESDSEDHHISDTAEEQDHFSRYLTENGAAPPLSAKRAKRALRRQQKRRRVQEHHPDIASFNTHFFPGHDQWSDFAFPRNDNNTKVVHLSGAEEKQLRRNEKAMRRYLTKFQREQAIEQQEVKALYEQKIEKQKQIDVQRYEVLLEHDESMLESEVLREAGRKQKLLELQAAAGEHRRQRELELQKFEKVFALIYEKEVTTKLKEDRLRFQQNVREAHEEHLKALISVRLEDAERLRIDEQMADETLMRLFTEFIADQRQLGEEKYLGRHDEKFLGLQREKIFAVLEEHKERLGGLGFIPVLLEKLGFAPEGTAADALTHQSPPRKPQPQWRSWGKNEPIVDYEVRERRASSAEDKNCSGGEKQFYVTHDRTIPENNRNRLYPDSNIRVMTILPPPTDSEDDATSDALCSVDSEGTAKFKQHMRELDQMEKDADLAHMKVKAKNLRDGCYGLSFDENYGRPEVGDVEGRGGAGGGGGEKEKHGGAEGRMWSWVEVDDKRDDIAARAMGAPEESSSTSSSGADDDTLARGAGSMRRVSKRSSKDARLLPDTQVASSSSSSSYSSAEEEGGDPRGKQEEHHHHGKEVEDEDEVGSRRSDRKDLIPDGPGLGILARLFAKSPPGMKIFTPTESQESAGAASSKGSGDERVVGDGADERVGDAADERVVAIMRDEAGVEVPVYADPGLAADHEHHLLGINAPKSRDFTVLEMREGPAGFLDVPVLAAPPGHAHEKTSPSSASGDLVATAEAVVSEEQERDQVVGPPKISAYRRSDEGKLEPVLARASRRGTERSDASYGDVGGNRVSGGKQASEPRTSAFPKSSSTTTGSRPGTDTGVDHAPARAFTFSEPRTTSALPESGRNTGSMRGTDAGPDAEDAFVAGVDADAGTLEQELEQERRRIVEDEREVLEKRRGGPVVQIRSPREHQGHPSSRGPSSSRQEPERSLEDERQEYFAAGTKQWLQQGGAPAEAAPASTAGADPAAASSSSEQARPGSVLLQMKQRGSRASPPPGFGAPAAVEVVDGGDVPREPDVPIRVTSLSRASVEQQGSKGKGKKKGGQPTAPAIAPGQEVGSPPARGAQSPTVGPAASSVPPLSVPREEGTQYLPSPSRERSPEDQRRDYFATKTMQWLQQGGGPAPTATAAAQRSPSPTHLRQPEVEMKAQAPSAPVDDEWPAFIREAEARQLTAPAAAPGQEGSPPARGAQPPPVAPAASSVPSLSVPREEGTQYSPSPSRERSPEDQRRDYFATKTMQWLQQGGGGPAPTATAAGHQRSPSPTTQPRQPEVEMKAQAPSAPVDEWPAFIREADVPPQFVPTREEGTQYSPSPSRERSPEDQRRDYFATKTMQWLQQGGGPAPTATAAAHQRSPSPTTQPRQPEVEMKAQAPSAPVDEWPAFIRDAEARSPSVARKQTAAPVAGPRPQSEPPQLNRPRPEDVVRKTAPDSDPVEDWPSFLDKSVATERWLQGQGRAAAARPSMKSAGGSPPSRSLSPEEQRREQYFWRVQSWLQPKGPSRDPSPKQDVDQRREQYFQEGVQSWLPPKGRDPSPKQDLDQRREQYFIQEGVQSWLPPKGRDPSPKHDLDQRREQYFQKGVQSWLETRPPNYQFPSPGAVEVEHELAKTAPRSASASKPAVAGAVAPPPSWSSTSSSGWSATDGEENTGVAAARNPPGEAEADRERKERTPMLPSGPVAAGRRTRAAPFGVGQAQAQEPASAAAPAHMHIHTTWPAVPPPSALSSSASDTEAENEDVAEAPKSADERNKRSHASMAAVPTSRPREVSRSAQHPTAEKRLPSPRETPFPLLPSSASDDKHKDKPDSHDATRRTGIAQGTTARGERKLPSHPKPSRATPPPGFSAPSGTTSSRADAPQPAPLLPTSGTALSSASDTEQDEKPRGSHHDHHVGKTRTTTTLPATRPPPGSVSTTTGPNKGDEHDESSLLPSANKRTTASAVFAAAAASSKDDEHEDAVYSDTNSERGGEEGDNRPSSWQRRPRNASQIAKMVRKITPGDVREHEKVHDHFERALGGGGREAPGSGGPSPPREEHRQAPPPKRKGKPSVHSADTLDIRSSKNTSTRQEDEDDLDRDRERSEQERQASVRIRTSTTGGAAGGERGALSSASRDGLLADDEDHAGGREDRETTVPIDPAGRSSSSRPLMSSVGRLAPPESSSRARSQKLFEQGPRDPPRGSSHPPDDEHRPSTIPLLDHVRASRLRAPSSRLPSKVSKSETFAEKEIFVEEEEEIPEQASEESGSKKLSKGRVAASVVVGQLDAPAPAPAAADHHQHHDKRTKTEPEPPSKKMKSLVFPDDAVPEPSGDELLGQLRRWDAKAKPKRSSGAPRRSVGDETAEETEEEDETGFPGAGGEQHPQKAAGAESSKVSAKSEQSDATAESGATRKTRRKRTVATTNSLSLGADDGITKQNPNQTASAEVDAAAAHIKRPDEDLQTAEAAAHNKASELEARALRKMEDAERLQREADARVVAAEKARAAAERALVAEKEKLQEAASPRTEERLREEVARREKEVAARLATEERLARLARRAADEEKKKLAAANEELEELRRQAVRKDQEARLAAEEAARVAAEKAKEEEKTKLALQASKELQKLREDFARKEEEARLAAEEKARIEAEQAVVEEKQKIADERRELEKLREDVAHKEKEARMAAEEAARKAAEQAAEEEKRKLAAGRKELEKLREDVARKEKEARLAAEEAARKAAEKAVEAEKQRIEAGRKELEKLRESVARKEKEARLATEEAARNAAAKAVEEEKQKLAAGREEIEKLREDVARREQEGRLATQEAARKAAERAVEDEKRKLAVGRRELEELREIVARREKEARLATEEAARKAAEKAVQDGKQKLAAGSREVEKLRESVARKEEEARLANDAAAQLRAAEKAVADEQIQKDEMKLADKVGGPAAKEPGQPGEAARRSPPRKEELRAAEKAVAEQREKPAEADKVGGPAAKEPGQPSEAVAARRSPPPKFVDASKTKSISDSGTEDVESETSEDEVEAPPAPRPWVPAPPAPVARAGLEAAATEQERRPSSQVRQSRREQREQAVEKLRQTAMLALNPAAPPTEGGNGSGTADEARKKAATLQDVVDAIAMSGAAPSDPTKGPRRQSLRQRMAQEEEANCLNTAKAAPKKWAPVKAPPGLATRAVESKVVPPPMFDGRDSGRPGSPAPGDRGRSPSPPFAKKWAPVKAAPGLLQTGRFASPNAMQKLEPKGVVPGGPTIAKMNIDMPGIAQPKPPAKAAPFAKAQMENQQQNENAMLTQEKQNDPAVKIVTTPPDTPYSASEEPGDSAFGDFDAAADIEYRDTLMKGGMLPNASIGAYRESYGGARRSTSQERFSLRNLDAAGVGGFNPAQISVAEYARRRTTKPTEDTERISVDHEDEVEADRASLPRVQVKDEGPSGQQPVAGGGLGMFGNLLPRGVAAMMGISPGGGVNVAAQPAAGQQQAGPVAGGAPPRDASAVLSVEALAAEETDSTSTRPLSKFEREHPSLVALRRGRGVGASPFRAGNKLGANPFLQRDAGNKNLPPGAPPAPSPPMSPSTGPTSTAPAPARVVGKAGFSGFFGPPKQNAGATPATATPKVNAPKASPPPGFGGGFGGGGFGGVVVPQAKAKAAGGFNQLRAAEQNDFAQNRNINRPEWMNRRARAPTTIIGGGGAADQGGGPQVQGKVEDTPDERELKSRMGSWRAEQLQKRNIQKNVKRRWIVD